MIPAHVHLVGIGGIGLSAIARLLLARGVRVSGSDQTASPITDALARLGARIAIGHRAENLGDAELVLVTSAAPAENPEVIAARQRGVRVVKRYDFFPELTAGKKTIAIAGTHGKTTTTALIAALLIDAGRDPDVIVGGIVPELGGNARAGQGEYFVIEADEYDRAFLGLQPTIAVITNIEMDHPDIFADVQEVARAFRAFMLLVPPHDGIIVGCGDSPLVAREFDALLGRWYVPYGFGDDNSWRADNVTPTADGGNAFRVWRGETHIGEFALKIPGAHNVLNALAAITVAGQLNLDWDGVRATLANFRGAARRFEITSELGGVTIIDDYAHHPTKIRATLAAARTRFPERVIWAVFQPHTFSRTLALSAEFARAFDDADHVLVTEIYPAREQNVRGISGALIVDQMAHADARFIPTLETCVEFLAAQVRAGDIVITLGAGDVNRVGQWLAQTRG